jgi:hypothetical protein
MSESSEKHRCITFGSGRFRIKFLDTMKFIASSLEKSAAAHLKNFKGDASKAFPTMLQYHPNIQLQHTEHDKHALLNQLAGKLPFAYDFMDGPECWSAAPVPPKKLFYNALRKEPVTDAEYIEVHNLADMTGAITFEHSLVKYLSNDLFPALINTPYANQQMKEEIAADPLLNRLATAQLKNVALASVRSLGVLASTETVSMSVVSSILPLFHHSDPDFRRDALDSFSQHVMLLIKA